MADAGKKALEIIGQMGALTERVEAANAKREAFIQERSRMVDDIIAGIGKLKLQNAKNGAEIQTLQEQLEENKKQLEELTKDVASHTQGGDALKKQIAELTSQLEEKNTELTRVTQELEQEKERTRISDAEMAKLKEQTAELERELNETKLNLAQALESQKTTLELSSELQTKIALIESTLGNNYDELKKEVGTLLASVDADDDDQRRLLQSILDVLGVEQRVLAENAFKNVARDKSPDNLSKSVAGTLSKSANNFITPFNNRMAKYFNFNELTQNYTPKDETTNLDLLGPLSIDAEELEKIEKLDPLFEKKLNAYEALKGEIQINPKVQVIGGRRKRTTQKKRPRNKKVTRRLAKRRRTQKKRRPIRKRRTARK